MCITSKMFTNYRIIYKMCFTVPTRNAGHSKWANIKHIKATKDAQRSTLFTRLSRQLRVAIQEGGSINPSNNLKLSQVIEQAKRANMPQATIQNVIKSTQQKKEDCKIGLIEIKGPSGMFIVCEIFTSNFNKCKNNIATVLKRYNASFSDGGGRHIFEQKGIVETEIPNKALKENELIELATEHAIESGAEDVKLIADDRLQFICGSSALKSVQEHLETFNYQVTSASVEYVPNVYAYLDDDVLEKFSSMFEKLENCEDVIKVYDNIG